MSDLPIGIVTFLFTDIAGSSNLWEQHTNAMSEALPRHDAMLREAIESRYGVVFKTVGDGSHAVFGNASDALAAAVADLSAVRPRPADRFFAAEHARSAPA